MMGCPSPPAVAPAYAGGKLAAEEIRRQIILRMALTAAEETAEYPDRSTAWPRRQQPASNFIPAYALRRSRRPEVAPLS
ncbi:hypothetical protein BN77_1449 [Rhizobium mesoamericanum STM3625]|uniref:Uncharacterized protein n=1 Tax=Rhizobium mesoamericanum STM3625 TaxID=1211777 RepID=K0PK69_9HYPH|nr:hypothetical protein BN77_1449 [Rhizobium mesoamericanum STM3625]